MLNEQVIEEEALSPSVDSDPVITDILSVATSEFALHGLAGARIERIVEHTKTSKRMIYYHFGSKEGLYRAVLERAFKTAREHDRDFDPHTGSPEQAMYTMVGNAFDAFMNNPDFVRLLSFENLSGALFIKSSQFVSEANQKAIEDLQIVINRGQAQSIFRSDINAMDAYINMVGLCFYHVAHHAGYLAAGFKSSEHKRIQNADFHAKRRTAIQETCLGYLRVFG
jgi:AcrR family transcriptional regulator